MIFPPRGRLAAYKPVAIKVANAIGEANEAATMRPGRCTHSALVNFITAAATGAQKALSAKAVTKSVEDGIKNGFKKIATGVVIGTPPLAAAGMQSWPFFLKTKRCCLILHYSQGVIQLDSAIPALAQASA
jgi:hypothetical protein